MIDVKNMIENNHTIFRCLGYSSRRNYLANVAPSRLLASLVDHSYFVLRKTQVHWRIKVRQCIKEHENLCCVSVHQIPSVHERA